MFPRGKRTTMNNTYGMNLNAPNGTIDVHTSAYPYVIESNVNGGGERRVEESPSFLLDPANEVIEFHGRRTELADLSEWRDSSHSVSARLLYGPGGQGKSRLGKEFAKSCAAVGWIVLRVSNRRGERSLSGEIRGSETPRPVLVVIDYADRWTAQDIEAVMIEACAPSLSRSTVRVLLMARSHKHWWDVLCADVCSAINVDTDNWTAVALDPAIVDTAAEFTRIREAFADVLEVDLDGHAPVDFDTSQPASQRILSVHMAALADVFAARGDASIPVDSTLLTQYLIQREKAYWRRVIEREHPDVDIDDLAKVCFMATLTGVQSKANASSILQLSGVADDLGHAKSLLKAHSSCYPPSAKGIALEPLGPDLLREDYVAALLGDGALGDDEAEDILRALTCRNDKGGYDPWVASVIANLSEAARHPHVRAQYLEPIVGNDPELALTSGTAMSGVVRTCAVDVLVAVSAVLPDHSHVDLDAPIVALFEAIVDARLHLLEDDDAGLLLRWYGHCLSRVGRCEDATDVTSRAVEIHRRLAMQEPAVFGCELAMSLNNLGNGLSSLGRAEEAVDALFEAVEIHGRLTAQDPAGYEPSLAKSLHNLGNVLAHAEKYEEAVAFTYQAIEIQQRLIQRDATRHVPGLAMSLNNLGNVLARIGREEDALDVAIRSNELHRGLAFENPPAYEPDFAMSLVNLSNRFAMLENYEEACDALFEAAEIYRRLTKKSPALYDFGLALSLHNLRCYLSDLGREDEAATVRAELDAYLADEQFPSSTGRAVGYSLPLFPN